ncbi:MAG: precorrin-2 C(20)-methyltransferase [Candidatus Bathyarchaeota archaeon]|nr:precorrin-2 C(20)-methyltransferase [Candidatus Bathyarchaeota archaeon]
MVGKFIGVGVGPGDPELITIKAAKTLKIVDIIAVPKTHADAPSMALNLVKYILKERLKPAEILELIFPMSKDEVEVKKLWAENALLIAEKVESGKTVAFITVGDPMFYSTFIYLFQTLREKHPKVKVEIIPGVTSLTACAAKAQIPIAEKEEVLVVIPSDLDLKLIEETVGHADTLVFMKCAHRFKAIIPILQKIGYSENATVAVVRRCGMPGEAVAVGRLADVQRWVLPEDYFSMAIVKREKAPINRG